MNSCECVKYELISLISIHILTHWYTQIMETFSCLWLLLPVSCYGCLTLVTKPLTQFHTAPHMALNFLEAPRSENRAACSPQSINPMFLWARTTGVCDPVTLDKHLSAHHYVCKRIFGGVWYAGVLCVISEVLNDLCSMCNWVALPEISVGLTLKPSFILGRLEWAHWTTGRRVQGCSLSSFERSSGCTTLLTRIYEAPPPILSHSGIYELINASYISTCIIFRLGQWSRETEGAR